MGKRERGKVKGIHDQGTASLHMQRSEDVFPHQLGKGGTVTRALGGCKKDKGKGGGRRGSLK